MGRPKLSAEDAKKRRKESFRKWRERPEAKQKKRETEKKRQAINHAFGKCGDCVKKYRSDSVKHERKMALQRERRARKRQNIQVGSESNQKNLQAINRAFGKSLDYVKKYRLDPVKYEREMALQRERRARKRQNIQIGSDNKRLCFDAESQVLLNKTRSKYLQAISDGPIHRCICCDRLWFKHSICHQSKLGLQNKKNITSDLVQSIFPLHVDEGTFCSTFMHNIKLGNVPPLAVWNGFKYTKQPACLAALNDLEERLVSLRILFMQIKECSYDRQLGIKGTIVNVPITLNQTVSTLPKNINDTATVHVKLKRRLKIKSDYMYRVINPK
ncbi:ATP-dependent DNA helicase [Trichonephila inaurata madagascariensis]|uniref:ATP-dependent DNA helicase n=1 Tax=Trichonephila inaurata madagascariensis TaxID=2747483 RepID=A0A8X6WQN7_9ARAC|nr:ATP-dependent DNA helicase [Trichonephila inaurata madagascariensis]